MQYLWIDSLCIFQDSHDDWQKEAATMRDVYRNAHLTISAVSGSDNDAGLFYEREITDLVPQSFELKTAQMNLSITYASQDARMQWLNLWREDGVTIRRGCCLQGRLLSPRTILTGGDRCFGNVGNKALPSKSQYPCIFGLIAPVGLQMAVYLKDRICGNN